MQTSDHLFHVAVLRERLAAVERDRDAALSLLEETYAQLGPARDWPTWGQVGIVVERIGCFLGHDDLLLREESHVE